MTRDEYAVHPVRQKFRDAKERLDAAREAFSRAQSDLIEAQQRYNKASRDFGREFMGEPKGDYAGSYRRK